MDDHEYSGPSLPLFRSFLTVAGGYLLTLVGFLGLGLLLLATVYPDSFALLTTPDIEKLRAALNNNPQDVLPTQFLFIMLVINALVCWLAGYLVARFAPFGRFMHAVFLAIILFIGFLQWAVGFNDDSSQQMMILFMGSAPICTLLGAKFFLNRTTSDSDTPEQ